MYQPSLNDLGMSEQTNSYKPSLSDLNLSNENNNQPSGISKDQLLSIIGARSSPVGNIMDAIYGFGKAGAGIAKTLTGGYAPEMPNLAPTNQNPLAVAIGQYLPFGLGGGGGLLGSTAAAGAFGATQLEPDQHGVIDTALNKFGDVPYGTSKMVGRTRNALEDAALNMIMHGLGGPIKQAIVGKKAEPTANINFKNQATFSPSQGEFANLEFNPPSFLKEKQPISLSGNIAEDLSSKIMGTRNLEQSGKELAFDINKNYQNIKSIHTAKFNKIFDSPTGEMSYQTGEPIIVKDKLMLNSNYRKNNSLADTNDKNLQLLDEKFMDNPSVENGHKLQSELGSEIGYLKKQRENGLLDAEGKNRLNKYVQAQNELQEDVRSELNSIDPDFMHAYDIAREDWRKNVIPYHSDKNLREIAEGRIKNPEANVVTGIFKNPEENINKISGDLSQEAKDRILHISLGKVKEDMTPQELLNARKGLELNGMSSYINPEHEQSFRNLRSNIQMENERKTQEQINKTFIEGLKKIQSQSENERLSASALREKGLQSAKTESNQILKNYEKKYTTEYEKGLKEAASQKKLRSDFFKKILTGATAVGAERLLGLNQADVLAAYLGLYYKGFRKKK